MKEIIKAWNEGALIEARRKNGGCWSELMPKKVCPRCFWNPDKYEYRIKHN